ncbi:FAD-binding protein, partial [Micromonospora zhanjiangensis]
MTDAITNWAGNVTFGGRRLARPASVDELAELVAGSDRVRALGSGHSFNRLADTGGDLVTVAGLPPTVRIDPAGRRVRVAAGVRYGELAVRLHEAGFALANLASLPHISVAGACATATHGSGVGNGNLSTAVSAMELVTADGSVVTVDRTTDGFAGTVVGLGCFGVVTELTLDIEPTYQVAQHVYDDLPLTALATDWPALCAAAYSVSLFTDWSGPRFNQVWLKRRVDRDPPVPGPRWLGAVVAE